MANDSIRPSLRWISTLVSPAIVAIAAMAGMPDKSVAQEHLTAKTVLQLAQAAPAAPGGAQQPSQPNGAPKSPQNEGQGQDHHGPGCRYQEKEDLQLLV